MYFRYLLQFKTHDLCSSLNNTKEEDNKYETKWNSAGKQLYKDIGVIV